VSDISLQFPWWFDLLLLVAAVFWPLTAAATAAAIWLWLQRSRLVVRIVTIPVLVLWVISASVHVYGAIDQWRSHAHAVAELQSRELTVTAPTRIGGIMLPPKSVVTRRYGGGAEDIEALDLAEPANVHGIPLIGRVEFDDAGQIHGTVTLAHDASIGEIPCSAKSSVIVLNGRLSSCTLALVHAVHGIPCRGTIDVTLGVECTLAARYERFGVVWPPQTFVNDSPPEGKTWFTTGPIAPSLRVIGSALPNKSVVEYTHNELSRITLAPPFLHFGGKIIDAIDVDGDSAEGEVARSDLNDPVRRVTLPAHAVQRGGLAR
jgi:hypothetical protein